MPGRRPVVGSEAYGFAGDAGIELVEPLGEQYCPEMSYVPAAADIGLGDDDPVVAQAFYDTVSIVRQRLVGKIEVAGIVDSRKHLIFRQETRGDAGFPQEWLELLHSALAQV